ncbi:MAG: hypothetical protein H0W72_16510 [Planctomycetes bacterium]|nr:hypothetical protein [Planctomycetota bacterium]
MVAMIGDPDTDASGTDMAAGDRAATMRRTSAASLTLRTQWEVSMLAANRGPADIAVLLAGSPEE